LTPYVPSNNFLLFFFFFLKQNSGIWQQTNGQTEQNGPGAFYLDWVSSGLEVATFHAATYFVLWTYLIPISLFVTLEVCRLGQAFFMSWDEKMVGKVCRKGVHSISKKQQLVTSGGRKERTDECQQLQPERGSRTYQPHLLGQDWHSHSKPHAIGKLDSFNFSIKK